MRGRGAQGASPCRVSPPWFPDRHLPSLPRVLAVRVSLVRRYNEGVRRPASLTPCSLPLLGATTVAARGFAPNAGEQAALGLELVTRCPAGMSPWRRSGPPKFSENPDCFCARFFDSGRTACPHCHDGAAAWPPLRERRRLPHWDFRSSIARPQSWLSTLRRVSYPTATQDSLPGAGQALLGGLDYPQGFSERFQSDLIPLPRAYLAQSPFRSSNVIQTFEHQTRSGLPGNETDS